MQGLSPIARAWQKEPSELPRLARSWAAAIPAAIGAFGLYQNAQAQKQQSKYQQQALKPAQVQTEAMKQIMGLATNYQNGGQATEDAAAISGANDNAAGLLKTSLGKLRSDTMLGGGSPTGDTEFGQNAQNVENRTLDPLRQFTAGLASSKTQRKANMFNSVFNAPGGQIANSYFTAANMSQPNYGPSLDLLSNALKKVTDRATGPGMTGGVNYGAGWDPLSGQQATGQDPALFGGGDGTVWGTENT